MLDTEPDPRGYLNDRHQLANGDIRDVEVHGSPLNVRGRRLLLCLVHDVTTRVDAEKKLRLAARVFECAPVGLMIADSELRIATVNPAFTDTTGYSLEEAVGKAPNMLNSGRQAPAYFKDMWASLAETGRWQGEIWNRRKNGDIYPEWLSINVIKNEGAEITHYVGIFTDISTHKPVREPLPTLAYCDALTPLPNRELLRDLILLAVTQAQRDGRGCALMFLDLDRFKTINHAMSHKTGDKLLEAVAEKLKHCVRKGDNVARLGGDEFTIVLRDITHAEDAGKVAQKIIHSFGRPFEVDGSRHLVTTSVGISLYPQDGEAPDALIEKADTAMYWAKNAGRNSYQFYSPEPVPSP
jgi:diguanylate cyclase (GGDEF)-like protein/PAS domain S-box-containing protein